MIAAFASLVCLSLAAAAPGYEVRAPGLTVKLSADGGIVGVALAGERIGRGVTGGTRLEGCTPQGPVAARKLDGGGVEFTRTLVSMAPPRQCTLVERFLPTKDSARWEIEIRGPGEPWTTPISTWLSYPAAASRVFWTAWSDPEHRSDGWRDPLQFRPFRNTSWTYANVKKGNPTDGDFIAMPLATAAEPAQDVALSVILSPEDTLLDVGLSTDESGSIVFSRTRHRLGGVPEKGTGVRFSLDLVGHPADWRAGLGWMAARYPQYFNPPNPKADAMAGCGAYSADERPIDGEKLRQMAFRINWKCSEDFPYMGMFLPPLADPDARWTRQPDPDQPVGSKPPYNSFRSLNDYCRRMRGDGFYVLSYFNCTEFGARMKYPAPPRKAADEADLWKDPCDYLYAKFPQALLLRNGKPIFTWAHAYVMDPGEPVYRQFLLEQARRHIEKQPDAAGICIDRLDWLRLYNPRGDDGVSWVDGRPARSLAQSWRVLMAELGPLMHQAGKVIFVNNHFKRLELLRHVDGIYCEFCQSGQALNSTGLLSVRRPAIGWTSSEADLRPDPDAFFQRHLHLGVFPTAPYPGNNHCINPSAWADRQYLDYGPLLGAMRGKKWVLTPHVVAVAGDAAKVNLFQVPGGYVLPVTFAGKAARVQVVLRGLDAVTAKTVCEALHPGSGKWIRVALAAADQRAVLEVPVERGCAMVRLRNP